MADVVIFDIKNDFQYVFDHNSNAKKIGLFSDSDARLRV